MEFKNFASRLGSDIVLAEANYFPAPPGATSTLHTHFNRLHITCVKRGFGSCSVGGIYWSLTPGTVHLVLPGERHHYQADLVNPYQIYFLHFDWYGPLPDELPRRMKIPVPERRAFFTRLHELSSLYAEPESSAGDFLRYGLVLSILGDLLRRAADAREKLPLHRGVFPGSEDRKLNRVMQALYGPPFSFPGLDALAELSGISRRTLISLFRRQTGMSIKQYYLNNIMSYAESMLADGSLRTRDIAGLCGYSNSQNFLYAYKRWKQHKTKVPPSIW